MFDYQLQVLDPSYYNGEPWQQMITNAGTAQVTGFTIEMNAALNDYTNIGMNMTSLESETSSDINLNPGNPSDPDSIEIPSGTRLPPRCAARAEIPSPIAFEVLCSRSGVTRRLES